MDGLGTTSLIGGLRAGALWCALVGGGWIAPARAELRVVTPGALERTVSAGDAAKGGALSVRMSADRTRMTVAERLIVTYEVTAARGAAVTLPTIGEELGDFRVASAEVVASRDGEPGRGVRLVLEPFLSGSKTIPALTFRAGVGDRQASVMTEPLSVAVSDVLTVPEGQQPPIAPAKPPMDVDEPARRAWPTITLGAVAGAAYVAAFGLAIAHARRRRAAVDPAGVLGAALDRASAACAVQSGSAGPARALAEVAAGVRRYMQDALGIAAVGASTPELVARVRDAAQISPEARSTIERMLIELESARFAPDAASVDFARAMIERAREVGRITSAPVGGEGAA